MSKKRRLSRAAPEPGNVRIIGGRWRNTRLPVADRAGLRPSSDRVRETLFNWLQPVLPGARVVDVFAGSGALGLEAVSRGAASAHLLEYDAAQVATLHAVVARLDAQSQVQVIKTDALYWLENAAPSHATIVFIDPPFAAPHLATAAITRLERHIDTTKVVWLYLETARAQVPPLLPAAWQRYREGYTRQVHYALYRRTAATLHPAASHLPTSFL